MAEEMELHVFDPDKLFRDCTTCFTRVGMKFERKFHRL